MWLTKSIYQLCRKSDVFVEKMIDEFDHCDAQSMQKLDLAITQRMSRATRYILQFDDKCFITKKCVYLFAKSNNNAGSKTFYLDNNLYVRFADEKISLCATIVCVTIVCL